MAWASMATDSLHQGLAGAHRASGPDQQPVHGTRGEVVNLAPLPAAQNPRSAEVMREGHELQEDDRKRGETEVQKLTDDMIKAADDVAAQKEKEILTQ